MFIDRLGSLPFGFLRFSSVNDPTRTNVDSLSTVGEELQQIGAGETATVREAEEIPDRSGPTGKTRRKCQTRSRSFTSEEGTAERRCSRLHHEDSTTDTNGPDERKRSQTIESSLCSTSSARQASVPQFGTTSRKTQGTRPQLRKEPVIIFLFSKAFTLDLVRLECLSLQWSSPGLWC